MRIPFEYLTEILKKTVDFQVKCPPASAVSLSRPKFLLPGTSPETGRLYISTPQAVDFGGRFPTSSALLTAEEPETLFNQIQELFDRCESWIDGLTAAIKTGDLRELLDEVEAILGNPILLRKSNYAIVACSGEVFSNPELQALRGTHLPFEYVNILKRDPRFEENQQLREPYFYGVPTARTPALGMNLFLEDDVTYCLSALPLLRPMQESDRFPMTLCAEHVSLFLGSKVIANRYADPSGRRERLVELFRTGVENENADLTVLEQGFSALGWLPTQQYCCLSVQLGTPDYLPHTAELLCSQLEALLPTACVLQRSGSIAVFLNMSQTDGTVRELLDKCIYFFRDNDLRTGVSNLFTGFRELRSYHRQSLIALDYASRPQAFLWVQFFSDIVLEYILEQSNRELPLNLVCSQKILQLRQYDTEHQTDFYVTLDSYIRNRFNAVQTAKELQIHRSTFLYRMERLQTLFGLDLEEEDSLLYTLLSMKMLELSKSMIRRE